jgi:hypothetical protein
MAVNNWLLCVALHSLTLLICARASATEAENGKPAESDADLRVREFARLDPQFDGVMVHAGPLVAGDKYFNCLNQITDDGVKYLNGFSNLKLPELSQNS